MKDRPVGMDEIPPLVDLEAEGWVETCKFEYPDDQAITASLERSLGDSNE